jgi:hypothetical protein
MAQTFTMSTIWALPLPDQVGTDSNYRPRAMFKLKLTGPATSVGAGMTIASISNDLYYIEHLWTSRYVNDDYTFSYSTATNNVASTAVVKILTASTGVIIADAVDLSATSWYVMGVGSGKFSTLMD